MKFTDKLKSMNACSDAIKWVGKRGLKTAWRDCNRADWMLWLAARSNVDKKLIVLAACDCAETALKYVPKGENRPAMAIQTSRNWCAGTATEQDCRNAAADAAYAAYAAAAAAYAAAYAAAAADAYAYAYATYAAAAAAYAAAAADAADADAYAAAAAEKTIKKLCANLVRKRIAVELIKL